MLTCYEWFHRKYDYDMCANCYAAHGVEGEYNKIERPVLLPPPVAMWTHGNSFHSRLVRSLLLEEFIVSAQFCFPISKGFNAGLM